MKKFNLSHKTHLLRISTIFCLLSSGLWVAPNHVHASLTGLQEYCVLSNEEQSYVTGGATADNRMVYPFQTDNLSLSVSKGDVSQTPSESSPSAPLQQEVTTTLTVNIISSPWATVDSNLQPSGDAGLPGVFVVEAVITNIGSTTATDVVVTLDYNEDPSSGWVLLAGEDPVRALDELAPGAAYYAYWFARYPNDARPEDILVPSHQYMVTAYAANASLVATSDNFYGNPAPGRTVQIRSTQNTGSSGLIRTSAEIVGGVALITVEYDLGADPDDAIFSPVGNDDFDPGAYRLLASQVRFYDDGETQESVITDRLYFPTVPRLPDNSPPDKAEATFTFITVLPSSTTVCPYAAFNFSPNPKYDKNFCSARNGGVISFTGTLTLSLTKQASSLTIEQGQSLTYTLHYTNNGDLPLSYGWIWDNVDINIGSIIATSVDPPSDPRQTTDSRVAWNLGTIPPDGTGTLTFAILIDGNGWDLADGTRVVNHAFFGVNPGSLAGKAALTSTVTTTVQAPIITLTKTDGRATAEPGDALMYTLRITNSGSIATSGLVITDELPAGVTLAGTTSPVFDSQSPDGQTLVWNSQDISAGDTLVVTIPVTVNSDVPDGTILTNTMTVQYENPAGWVFATQTATDTTTVHVPPTVAFTAASQSGSEDVGTMTITAQLDRVSGLDVTVPFVVGGTATEGVGQDYTITSSPVVIPAGSLTAIITINVNDDSLYEADETVIVTMGTPTNADRGTPAVHTATITDNDASQRPTVAFTAASQSGSEGVGTMIITAQLDRVSGLGVTVPFVVGGTATEGVGQDYTITSSPVTIAAGSLATIITINVNDDSLYEADETVIVTMGTPVNADRGTPAVHTATITDNDASQRPTVAFTAASQSRSEDVGTMIITARLDRVSGLDVTVPFVVGGTATEGVGQDYTITSSPVMIPAGSLTAIITINVNDDSLYEADETVIVTMGTPTNADRGTPAVHTATIIDNDASHRPTVDFSSATYSVDEGASTATITVTLDVVSGLAVTVDYATSDGIATAGSDYTAASGTLTFNPGVNIRTFTVAITDDALAEGNETVTLTLSNVSNANLDGNNPATLTIMDDDTDIYLPIILRDY